jgi:Helix-turn-helix domain
MGNQISKAEWAIEKVRVYVPSRPDKITLMAIAGYVNYSTGVAWCARSTIAGDIGKSSRTVQRHIQSLITGRTARYYDRVRQIWVEPIDLPGGELLIADKPDRFEHRTSRYMIPCCSLTVEELEFITGLPGQQLNLSIIPAEEQGSLFIGDGTLKSVVERQWEANCLTMGDKLSPDGRQIVSLTVSEQRENNELGQIVNMKSELPLVKKGKKAIKLDASQDLGVDGKVEIAPATIDLISGTLAKLAVGAGSGPVGLGSRLRERFDAEYGPAADRPV